MLANGGSEPRVSRGKIATDRACHAVLRQLFRGVFHQDKCNRTGYQDIEFAFIKEWDAHSAIAHPWTYDAQDGHTGGA